MVGRVEELIVVCMGGATYLLCCRWMFGGNPFKLPRMAVGLGVGLLCVSGSRASAQLAPASPQASAYIAFYVSSEVGQGGNPLNWLGGNGQYGSEWYVPDGTPIATAFNGWQQGNLSQDTEFTINVQLYQFQGYWSGAFTLVECNGNVANLNWPSGGNVVRAVLTVYDTAADRHCEIAINGQTYEIHGDTGDTSASYIFNREVPADKDGYLDPYAYLDSSPYRETGIHYSKALSGFNGPGQGGAGTCNFVDVGYIQLTLPSVQSTTQPTTQSTSQPSYPGSDGSIIDEATGAVTGNPQDGNQHVPAYAWGHLGTDSTHGPQAGDSPAKSSFTGFVQASDILSSSDWQHASESFNALLEDLVPGVTGTGSMWTYTDPRSGNSTNGWQFISGVDGINEIIQQFCQGLANFQTTMGASFMPWVRMITGAVVVFMTLRHVVRLVAWGLAFTQAHEASPPGVEGAAELV